MFAQIIVTLSCPLQRRRMMIGLVVRTPEVVSRDCQLVLAETDSPFCRRLLFAFRRSTFCFSWRRETPRQTLRRRLQSIASETKWSGCCKLIALITAATMCVKVIAHLAAEDVVTCELTSRVARNVNWGSPPFSSFFVRPIPFPFLFPFPFFLLFSPLLFALHFSWK